ncbi:MAG: response regulator [Myxococcota bacterium]|nr:response regulator [Myxococcota bacterium]
MTKKRVVFVDDEVRVLEGLKRLLRPMRHEWEMVFADSGKKALALMEERPFDVIVTDMRMPEMDGAQLLTEVMKRYPSTVRIVLSGQASKEAMMRSIGPSHQYLSKPCDAETLKAIVTRACALRDILTSDRLSFVARMKNLPSLPEIYQDLLAELKSDEPSLRLIGRLIEKDVGMTAKVLQLVNSAYFGVRRNISNPAAAVNLLGIENVRSLVLFANIFSKVDASASASGLSMDTMWKHSAAVGKLSHEILKYEQLEKHVIDEALTAGLLHDCGKLVFAANMGKKYAEALNLSIKEEIPLLEAEQQVFDATHAEAGAYLLGLWGLPDSIVEAVAFHHNPSACMNQNINVLTAVHVADGLTREQGISGSVSGLELLDMAYLEQLNIVDRVAVWNKLDVQEA